jgi:hypothetical protein
VKRIFLLSFAWMLMACAPLAPEASSPVLETSGSFLVISTSIPADQITPAPTWTYLIPPTPTATIPATPTTVPDTATPLPSPLGPTCLTLISPADGTTFLKKKAVKFTWYAKQGTQSYVLLLVHQNGFRERIVVPGTELTLDQKAKVNDLTYQWSVAAYDANNQLICNSPTWTYTLYSPPTVTPFTGGQAASP